jgi:hypothetical protein
MQICVMNYVYKPLLNEPQLHDLLITSDTFLFILVDFLLGDTSVKSLAVFVERVDIL